MRAIVIGLCLGLAVVGLIALGWYAALDYGHDHEPEQTYQPGVELDIDRAKPRPTFKQSPPKQAAPKVRK